MDDGPVFSGQGSETPRSLDILYASFPQFLTKVCWFAYFFLGLMSVPIAFPYSISWPALDLGKKYARKSSRSLALAYFFLPEDNQFSLFY